MPTSSVPSRSSPRRSRRCVRRPSPHRSAMRSGPRTHEGDGGDERRGRFVRRRRSARCRRPRRRRRDDAPVGRGERHGLLQRVRCRRRPSRRRRPRYRAPRVQLQRRLRRPRRRRRTSPHIAPGSRRIRASSATARSSSPACPSGPPSSASTPWPPGHHARIGRRSGQFTLERGADRAKDQSYVVHMLDQSELARTLFPIGSLTKGEVRRRAAASSACARRRSRTARTSASSPRTGGRQRFLGRRIPFTPARVVDSGGSTVGTSRRSSS